MEYFPGGFTLHIPKNCFPLSTDSMALAHFVKLPKYARVLDFGSGCGTLGLLLCAKDAHCQVTGLELTEDAHAAALGNIQRNDLHSRLESICAPLQSVSERFSPGQFDVCISNPPYFSGGPASHTLPTARREDNCRVDDLMKAAGWCLKFGGDFFLVHRPEKLGELISTAGKYGLEAKKLCLLRHRPSSPVNLILLQMRKGGNPGLQWEEIHLYHNDGTPTEDYRSIYHMF